MISIEKILRAVDECDLEWFEQYVHQEYIYVDDFNMLAREDWFVALKEFMEGDYDMTYRRRILVDERDVTSFQHVREIDGIEYVITNVHLLKDGKIWRHIVNRIKAQITIQLTFVLNN